MSEGLLFVLIAHIPPHGIESFNAYEDRVLPLLGEHGGVLQRRLRSDDGGTEVHLVWFPSSAAFEAYRADPRRAELAPLMAASEAGLELLSMRDV